MKRLAWITLVLAATAPASYAQTATDNGAAYCSYAWTRTAERLAERCSPSNDGLLQALAAFNAGLLQYLQSEGSFEAGVLSQLQDDVSGGEMTCSGEFEASLLAQVTAIHASNPDALVFSKPEGVTPVAGNCFQ